MVWIYVALLLGLCTLALLGSFVRTRLASGPFPEENSDIAFYHAQIAEIAREGEAGLIMPGEEKVAVAEAGRRLLTAARQRQAPDTTPVSAQKRLRLAVIVVLAAISTVSLPLYAYLGSPDIPSQPLAERRIPDPAQIQVAAFISQIERRLDRDPDDVRGLELIAPLYLRAGKPQRAAETIAHLIAVGGSTPERQADLGEALTAAGDGIVTSEAKAAFEAALALKPGMPKAQFYLARAYAQSGDKPKAHDILTALLSSVPSNGPLHALIDGELAGLQDRSLQDAPKKGSVP